MMSHQTMIKNQMKPKKKRNKLEKIDKKGKRMKMNFKSLWFPNQKKLHKC